MISSTSSNLSQIASALFSKLDTSNKGYIQESELQSAFSSIDGSDTDVSELFNQLDGDGDGKVTEDEMSSGLESLLGQLNSQFNQMRVQDGMPPPPPPPSDSEDEGYTLDELKSISSSTDDSNLASLMSTLAENFDTADTDGDGKVNAEEAHAYQDQQRSETFTSSTSGLEYMLQKLISAYGGSESSSSSAFSYSA